MKLIKIIGRIIGWIAAFVATCVSGTLLFAKIETAFGDAVSDMVTWWNNR